MLEIRVAASMGAGGPLASRFETLVRRLLPPGWQFRIDQRAVLTRTSGSVIRVGGFGAGGWDVYLYGAAVLTNTGGPSRGGRLEMREQAALRDKLREVCDAEGTTTITLTSENRAVLVGQFNGSLAGWIDVRDLELLGSDVIASSFLVHELEEQFQRQVGGPGGPLLEYLDAHASARASEMRVMGGTRREDQEFISPRGSRGWWWIPYERPSSSWDVTAVHCEVRFRSDSPDDRRIEDTLRGFTRWFGSIDAFVSSARSAGLVLGHPEELEAGGA